VKKGDRVLVKAIVTTFYTDSRVSEEDACAFVHIPKGTGLIKVMITLDSEEPWLGLVMGYSYRATGHYYTGNDGEGHLAEDQRHKVWLVQPLETHRYLQPTACREEDLDIVS